MALYLNILEALYVTSFVKISPMLIKKIKRSKKNPTKDQAGQSDEKTVLPTNVF